MRTLLFFLLSFLSVLTTGSTFEHKDDLSFLEKIHSFLRAGAKYLKNPHVDDETWEMLTPYFLPDHHPLKAPLDRIFSKPRVLASKKSLRAAGFTPLAHPQNRLIIARHSKLKGYLIKAYLDDAPTTDWIWWKKRIDGAHTIQNSINQHGYQSLMKVPQKWIYPLPDHTLPRVVNGIERKNFILVVEDMKLLSPEKNLSAFKHKLTKQHLNALYTVILENLLIDSVYADNIPFSKDGRIAFIDTEHCMDTTQPVRIERLAQYFSSEMHAYWEQLIQHGVPVN